MKTLLWLDDLRDPFTDNWLRDYAPTFDKNREGVTWVKNYEDFCKWIKTNGLPYMIAFDHDLGEDIGRAKVANGMSKRQARKEKKGTPTGYDAAHWVIEYCLDKKIAAPDFVVQSANPIGADNIRGLFSSYIKWSKAHGYS